MLTEAGGGHTFDSSESYQDTWQQILPLSPPKPGNYSGIFFFLNVIPKKGKRKGKLH